MSELFKKQFEVTELPRTEDEWTGSLYMLVEAVKQDQSLIITNDTLFNKLYKSIESTKKIVKFIDDNITTKLEYHDRVLIATNNKDADLLLETGWDKYYIQFMNNAHYLNYGICNPGGSNGRYCYVETNDSYVDYYKSGGRRKVYLNKNWDNDGAKYYNPDGSRQILGGLRELFRSFLDDTSDLSR